MIFGTDMSEYGNGSVNTKSLNICVPYYDKQSFNKAKRCIISMSETRI